MPIINIVTPEKAEGQVKENYSLFDQMGMVPLPMQMFSSTPGLQTARMGLMRYYLDHPTLSPGLMALIRMLVAEDLQYHYCIALNGQILKMMGITSDDQVGAILADPTTAPLSDKDKAMLLFVLKAVKTPEAVEAADTEALRDLGWTDGDIVDATMQGVGMVADGIMFKAFKMGEGASC